MSLILPDFKVQWLVNETKRNIPKELDFEVEADNTEKAKVMFHHMPWLKVRLQTEIRLTTDQSLLVDSNCKLKQN